MIWPDLWQIQTQITHQLTADLDLNGSQPTSPVVLVPMAGGNLRAIKVSDKDELRRLVLGHLCSAASSFRLL